MSPREEPEVPPVVGDDPSMEEEDDQSDDGDHLSIKFMTGMIDDLKLRLPIFLDDWKKPDNLLRVFNATFYAFVVQLIPALIFAEVLDRQTEGNLAVAEVLLSAGIIGCIYALFAGQPLTVLGITGPTSLLLGTSYGLADRFNADYFTFYWWVIIWSAIMHILAAVFGLVSWVWRITPFTLQIFEFFIGVSFCYESIRDLIVPANIPDPDYDSAGRAASYANILIGVATFYICWTLHFAETWTNFTELTRDLLTAYNMMIALIIMTAVSYLPGLNLEDQDHPLERVNIRDIPYNWQPTADRVWAANPLEGIDVGGIFAAMFPGFMFFALFFIDHNVSSIMAQSPKFHLKKPAAYHWDFFILGITMIPCGILGVPPGNGLIPQAPLHVRALCKRDRKVIDGVTREVFSDCQEQRWSAFFQAALMFVALAAIKLISWIPVGCLFGIFLYLGVTALYGNEIMERLLYITKIPEARPPTPIIENVPWRKTQLYTFIQAACGLCIFAVGHFSDVGYIFPALVAALVPIRSFIVHYLFSQEELEYLDPHAEAMIPPSKKKVKRTDSEDGDEERNAESTSRQVVGATEHDSDEPNSSDDQHQHEA